jgi:hypothetical protein
MQIFQTIGFFIGFPILIYYSLFDKTNYPLVFIAIAIIIASRFIGYGIDCLKKKK